MSVVAMQSYRDRINTVIPKYVSPDHNWEMVQAAPVTVADYVTEDGEERPTEWPFNFVKHVDQATQLAAYKLVDAREIHPIEIVCGPRVRAYRPGECLHLDLPQLGLDTDAIILRRSIDPATMTVSLTLVGETPAKHAFALGQTGTAPDTPTLTSTPQQRDETAANSTTPLATTPISTDLSAVTGALAGEADLTWRNPEQTGWSYVKIHHATSNVFSGSTAEVTEIVGALGEVMAATVTGLTIGTHYFWIVAYDASDVPFTESTSDSAAVT